MRKILPFLLGFYYSVSAIAQTSDNQTNTNPCPGVSKIWDATFGGESIEEFSTVIKTKDGGYLMGGSSQSKVSGDKTQDSSGPLDYWIVKVDADGRKLWDKNFGGNHLDMLKSIIATNDGGYLLAGGSWSDKSGDVSEFTRGEVGDIWIVKIDANGNKQWDKRYGGKLDESLSEVIATKDGGYLLAGTSGSGISGEKTSALRGEIDYWIVKIDAKGTKLWDKTFGGDNYDIVRRVIATADGGFLLGGYTESGKTGEITEDIRGWSDIWIVKTDEKGNKLWDKRFGGDRPEGLATIIATPDGNYLLGGLSLSNKSGDVSEESRGDTDYWVVKIDAKGTKLWDKRYGGDAQDVLTNMHLDDDGGLLLAGYANSWISGEKTIERKGPYYDYWIVKTNSDGKVSWNTVFRPPGTSAEIGSLRPTLLSIGKGEYIFGIHSGDGITENKTQESKGNSDFWIAKLKVCGNEKK